MADSDSGQVGQASDGLQVELFHPDSDRAPGDTNIQGFGFDIHPIVFPLAVVIIALFIAATIILGDAAAGAYQGIFDAINVNFGWFYILAVNIFILALVYFALSKYGKIRLGGVYAEEEFSTFSWMAMLFSAGMGIGLMFWSVAEPMWHMNTGGGNLFPYAGGIGAEATGASAQAALATTIFHWGFHPWAIYGLVALGLGFFSFNRGLPLTFRSVFYPLLGDRIYGWPGHVIDLITVFATLFGLGTSLGLGAQQIAAGLNIVGGIPSGTTTQVGVIAVVTGIATLSVAAGLNKGVKRLSQLNVYIMLAFLAFILAVGPTLFLLDGIVQSVGFYLQNFFEMSWWTDSFFAAGAAGALGGGARGSGYADWGHFWTVFYWGWWLAWSPFVGLFIARISRGKTIRQMVIGVLLIPTTFSAVWLGAFGGAAIFADVTLGAGIASTVFDQGNAFAMFAMLDSYPLSSVTSVVAILLVTTFFVTSSDSGSLVVDHLTSGGKHDVPRGQRIFWAVTEGAVAAVLLIGGGLSALQTASITTGLPFAAILLVMVYSTYVGLNSEYAILMSEEFRERVKEIAQSGEEVDIPGQVFPGDVRDAETDD
jgi:choline/carnitine/betaine transport